MPIFSTIASLSLSMVPGVAWMMGFSPGTTTLYHTYDYYPYDYYPGYYADVEPYDYNENVYSNTPMVDPTVTAVEKQLTQLGYYSGPIDGIYGPLVRDAVAKYQIATNQDVTGKSIPGDIAVLRVVAAGGRLNPNTRITMKWQLVVLFPREFRRLREWRSRLLQKVVVGRAAR